MTKSKTFWIFAALLSLGVTVFSGYSVYERLNLHFSDDTLDLKSAPVTPLPQPDEPPQRPGAAAPAKETAPAGDAKKSEPEKIRAMKTRFEYKDSKAKTVYIAGSFTSWKDVKMAKKDGAWKAEVYILPGTYPYHFTVDGRKKADPGKPSAPTGDSLITVTSP